MYFRKLQIFEKDKQGECSVEIVRMIAALVKKKGNNVNGLFVSLPLCSLLFIFFVVKFVVKIILHVQVLPTL